MSDRPAGAPTASIVAIGPDSWTQPFWDAANEHRLIVARCAQCGTYRMPPSPFCANCLSQDTEWVELSGRANLFTFTVVRHPVIPDLVDSVPYVIAVVSLSDADEVKLVTNIVDCDPDTLEIGQAVEVVWDKATDDVTVPRFRPVP